MQKILSSEEVSKFKKDGAIFLKGKFDESWIKKLKLVEEFQHYLVLSSPTRFIRDWVVSRYIDKIFRKVGI